MDSEFDYKILVNAEGQFPSGRVQGAAAGWEETGPTGSKDSVMAWIDANWTDLRPKSLQLRMQG